MNDFTKAELQDLYGCVRRVDTVYSENKTLGKLSFKINLMIDGYDKQPTLDDIIEKYKNSRSE